MVVEFIWRGETLKRGNVEEETFAFIYPKSLKVPTELQTAGRASTMEESEVNIN